MAIRIAQSSTPAGPGHWRWSVWLEGPGAELDGVEYVVYTLHSTFSEPVRMVSDRASGFRLDSSGWGEFALHATLHHRDGRVEKLKHWLVLGTGAGPKAPTRGADETRIYLSYSLADAPAAHAIQLLLREQPGVTVTTSEELADSGSEIPFERLIEDKLRSVSNAVFLVSRNSSPWIQREAETAERLGIPRAVISVGDTGASASLADGPAMASLQVKGLEPDNAADVALAITRWTREG